MGGANAAYTKWRRPYKGNNNKCQMRLGSHCRRQLRVVVVGVVVTVVVGFCHKNP